MSPETAKILNDLAPVGTMFISATSAIGGAIWIVITYIRTQRDLSATKLFEAKKTAGYAITTSAMRARLRLACSSVSLRLPASAASSASSKRVAADLWRAMLGNLFFVGLMQTCGGELGRRKLAACLALDFAQFDEVGAAAASDRTKAAGHDLPMSPGPLMAEQSSEGWRGDQHAARLPETRRVSTHSHRSGWL